MPKLSSLTSGLSPRFSRRFSGPPGVEVQYLVVAGGGGGGSANVSNVKGGGAAVAGSGTGEGGGNGGWNGGTGGSGIVIIKIPDSRSATFSVGVTQTSTTSGGYKVYTITAAGASDTVTFS